MQTKLGSLTESITNIIAGYIIAVLSQVVIFPYFDIYISLKSNLYIGLWFTGISFTRSYLIRRFFNGKIKIHNED